MTHQTPTYFLAEAQRRRREAETVTGWVVREGFFWGIERLEHWMVELKQLALELHSPELGDYLEVREKLLLKQQAEVAAGLENLAQILNLGKGASP
jgi:hypothetical protein